MRKLILTFAILFGGVSAFAQSAKFEDLDFFNKIILKGNISKVVVEGGDRQITVDGVNESSVDMDLNAGIITLEVESANPVEVRIANGSLKWIEAPSDADVSGVEFLEGGNGTYLLTGRNGSYYGTWDNYATDVIAGDLDFDFDFDFDLDFDYDFDFDYNFDFAKDIKLKYKYSPKEKHDVKVKVKEKENKN